MGTEKRERQKANRKTRLAEVQAEEAKEVREASTKKYGKIAAVVAGVVALFVLVNFFTGDDEPVAQFEPTAEDGAAEERPEIVLASSVPSDFEPFAGNRALALVEPEARNGAYDEAPPMTIDVEKTYIAVIDTDVGDFSIELFPQAAPVTVNNFVNLARDGFYDGTVFHRVLEGFMAQGGDPSASGAGGPGYAFQDEFESGLAFDKTGLLAMANSGANTNGSQFFITFDVAATTDLTGKHTIFGEVVRNEDVLAQITRVDPNGSAPDTPLTVIESIRIVES